MTDNDKEIKRTLSFEHSFDGFSIESDSAKEESLGSSTSRQPMRSKAQSLSSTNMKSKSDAKGKPLKKESSAKSE